MDEIVIFEKEINLIGEESFEKLQNSMIVLFGLGGVGSFTFEALVRSGIKNFIIVDKDTFDISNINRQLEANMNTIGKNKVDIYAERAKLINPKINVIKLNVNINGKVNDIFKKCFEMIYSNTNNSTIYAIDCIDDMNAKLEIIKYCHNNNLPIISSMGTANHIQTEKIKITDINKTEYCPVAKIFRKKLKENMIEKLDVLYIDEPQIINKQLSSISYVPSACGLKIAEYVIRKII